jgi:hypothetical protein
MRSFGSRVCPAPLQHTLVQARVRCRTRPYPDTCLDRNGCARFAFHSCPDPVFAPAAPCARGICAQFHESVPGSTRPRLESVPGRTRLRPFPCVRPEAFVPAPAAGRRVCAQSHASTPGVRARSYPSAPFTTHSSPTRSRFYQRVHVPDRTGD